MNTIAAQSLDHAPARRRVRSAFIDVHKHLDHCLFKVDHSGIKTEELGYAVYAVDYPGFGLSEGLHGYISDFDELVDDVIEQFTDMKARLEAKGLLFFVMGESMGGAVTLKIHPEEPREWDGLILVAPMCKIADDVMPPAIVLEILALMSEVLPQAKLFPQKNIAHLSYRDPKKRETFSRRLLNLYVPV